MCIISRGKKIDSYSNKIIVVNNKQAEQIQRIQQVVKIQQQQKKFYEELRTFVEKFWMRRAFR